MEVGTRQIAHFNVTAHPTAEWTLQQFREVASDEPPYRFVLHDRDSIFSAELDSCLQSMGTKVWRTPYRAPQANAFCERLIGTMRRECLDFLIPWSEKHLRRLLKEWVVRTTGLADLMNGPMEFLRSTGQRISSTQRRGSQNTA